MTVLMATVSAAGLLAAAPAIVHAQDAQPAATNDVTEVIVTASKRKERVQSVPQTVNVVTSEALQKDHIQSFQEVAVLSAGLSLTRTSGDEQSVSLRGIKMPGLGGIGGTTNTVDVYFNEVPIATQDAFNSIYDIGQIEVLRGPQGTLRGRTSPSGAITIATQRPSYTTHSGFVEGTLSDNNGKNLQAAYGGPITDTLAFRLAGLYDANDDNGVKDIANGDKSHHETRSVRGTLMWKPTDDLEFTLIGQGLRDDRAFYRSLSGTGTAISHNAGQTFQLDDRTALNSGRDYSDSSAVSTVLTGRYDLGNYQINYVGGYVDSSFAQNIDLDFANTGVMLPKSVTQTIHQKTLTNELRFETKNNAVYNWTYGVFSSHNDFIQLTSVVPFFFNSPNAKTIKDYGIFTNQRFNLTAKDKVQLGLRYSNFEVSRSAGSVTYQATTGNASYQHEFSRDLMLYASYGTSFRPGSGGANTGTTPIPASFHNFGAEHSDSVELGVKSQWFAHRLTANLAVFKQKYNGYIGSSFVIACTGVPSSSGTAYATNDGTATGPSCTDTMFSNGNALSSGIEFEGRYLITSDWSVGLNAAYTDAHYDHATIPCNDYNGDGSPDVSGAPKVQQGQYVSTCVSNASLGQLPKVSITANTDYSFKLWGLDAYVRANAAFHDKAYFPQTAATMPSYTLVNGFVGLKGPDGKWELSLFAKNLFDSVVQDTDGGPWFTLGQDTGYRVGTVTKGREIGVTLRRDF